MKQEQKLFHTQDLAILWGISNKNTLYTTIKRYLSRGVLIPIHKGYYATIPLDRIDPIRLAIGYLHRYAYLSCETVLTQEGVIFQKENNITLVSDISKRFEIAGSNFFVRKMKDIYLYNQYGVVVSDGVMSASLERAVADMIYFSPNYYFDNERKIDWLKVKKIQKEVGY